MSAVPRRPYDAGKRAIDFSVASVLFVLTLPLQALVALVIVLRLGRPVLFHQARPGRNGEIFKLVKFRTMMQADPAKGLVEDADRMTPVGAFLRSTSLDELPTLVNVMKGDMSLVGPRPLLVSYLARYSSEQARRHEVRPGVTGLAQVSGRNSISWDRKLSLDIYYVDHRSLKMDVWVLWKTIGRVFRRDGISANGHVTMHEFSGTRDSEDLA